MSPVDDLGDGGSGYRWRGGLPHRGWTLLYVSDLGAPAHVCEMCSYPTVRYVHTMSHPQADEIAVGCVCASKMAEDYETSSALERDLRNRAARRANWKGLRWRTSAKGNLYLRKEGRIFVVKRQGVGYVGMVATPTGETTTNENGYDTPVMSWANTDGVADLDTTLFEMFDWVWPRKLTANVIPITAAKKAKSKTKA